MKGIALIEGKALTGIIQRLANIEQNQLAILKVIQQIIPPIPQNSIPDFISIEDASRKYKISQVTVNKKLKLFESIHKRKVDRIRSGNYKLINENELCQAIRIKTPTPDFYQMRNKKKQLNKVTNP